MSNEELVRLYQQGDSSALDRLVENNHGIVYKLANKYKHVNRRYDKDSSQVPEDLVQAGYLGLIKAAKKYKFDCDKRAQFITYAVHWINREIHMCVNGRSEKDFKNNKLYSECSSLNVVFSEDNDAELIELIEDVDYGFENVIELEFIRELRIQLEEVMKQSNTLMERDVLKLRNGWNTNILCYREIGEIYGITKGVVRVIEGRAIRKIRNSKWVRQNAKEFNRLGYINDSYADILKTNGINM